MKHPAQVRDRVLARVVDMLEHLRIQMSCYSPDELDVLKQIEPPQQLDMAVGVANYIMTELGHENFPSEPRFDKTRRQANKRRGRPPKGLTPEERAKYYEEPASA